MKKTIWILILALVPVLALSGCSMPGSGGHGHEASAMTDAYGMIKVLVRKGNPGPISVVVNMAHSVAEGKRTYQRLADVTGRFLQAKLYYAGTLLKDDRLCRAVRARTPVVLAYPQSQIASSFSALAARLGGVACERNNQNTFFRRVIRWLS